MIYQLEVVEFVMMKVVVMDAMGILLVLECVEGMVEKVSSGSERLVLLCIEGMVEKVSSGSARLIALWTFSRQVQNLRCKYLRLADYY